MLSVIMATRNGADTLPTVLERYCRLQPPQQPWRLLVVENGSTDDTFQILTAYQRHLPMLLLRCEQTGKNHALNHALDHLFGDGAPAAEDMLIFTDDDALPAMDWLRQWEQCSQHQPQYAIFGGSILPDWAEPPPAWLLQNIPLGLMYGLTSSERAAGVIHPGLAWGANMALRASLLWPARRFDHRLGPCGTHYAMGSETELTRRLARLGHQVWFCPQAQVAHHIRRSQLSLAYLLAKAQRAGRGQYLQDQPGLYPEWRRVPRWLWRRYLQTGWACLRAAVLRQRQELIRQRWDLAFLHGYVQQARLGRPAARRVLLTSYSGELGGMELRMAQEARFLRSDGCDAVLALPEFAGFERWQQQLAQEQLLLLALPTAPFLEIWPARRRHYLQARLLQARRLRTFQAGLVHIAWCWTHYGASATWLAHAAGIPAVISVHNSFAPTTLSPWHRRHLTPALRNVRGIYAVSASAMQAFLAIYQPLLAPATRLAVIPNCVDIRRFRPDPVRRAAARRQWQIADDALVIGSVGRLSVQKQPLKLLQIFCRLRQQFPRLVLVLAGDGPQQGELLERVTALGLDKSVICTGYRQDVEHLLPALDLHLLFSRNEGFGIATIEAMACGLPVVASNVAGSRDILADSRAGLLVAPDTLEDCVTQIARLLDDEAARTEMGRHARAEAIARYSEEVVCPQVQAFYHGLV